MTVFAPLLVLLLAAAVLLTRRWDLLAPSLGLTLAFLLGGLGAGSFVGGLWQWPAPPPGSSPFQKGSSGGLPAFLSFTVATLITGLVGLPTVALVVWSFWTPWAGWASIPVGLVTGLVVLRLGLVHGGRLLDRRWPEVMAAVSERRV